VTAAQRRQLDQLRQTQMKEVMANAEADVTAVHVVRGRVDQSLWRCIRERPTQLLAMGIISRRWIQRFLIGDTAESVVRGVPCDLLLIKPDDFRLRLGRSRQEHVVLPKAKKTPPRTASKTAKTRSTKPRVARQPKRKTR
jgi:hypothetical protein